MLGASPPLRCTKRAENARGTCLRAVAPRGSAGPRAARHGGRSARGARAARLLEAEFDRLAQGQPVVVVGGRGAPLLAELIDDGDLGADELRQMWGPATAASWRSARQGDLFEDEDDEVAAPAAAAGAGRRRSPGAGRTQPGAAPATPPARRLPRPHRRVRRSRTRA